MKDVLTKDFVKDFWVKHYLNAHVGLVFACLFFVLLFAFTGHPHYCSNALCLEIGAGVQMLVMRVEEVFQG